MSLRDRMAARRRDSEAAARQGAKAHALKLLAELREMVEGDAELAKDAELDLSMRELLRTSLRAQGRHVAARLI